jgi:hypothetical protein
MAIVGPAVIVLVGGISALSGGPVVIYSLVLTAGAGLVISVAHRDRSGAYAARAGDLIFAFCARFSHFACRDKTTQTPDGVVE